jgi:type II secretory ATPase GspE/PulE/Tfp pilus assembly ATPase PilB-like protein
LSYGGFKLVIKAVQAYLKCWLVMTLFALWLHNKISEADIRAAAIASGMTLLRDNGERLITQGITSREEVVRVTRD